MNVGRFRQRVTIQKVDSSQNSLGERVETWSEVADRWAKVEPLRGRSLWNAKQVMAELDTKITLRYLSGIVPAMRVKHGEDIYKIESVINPEMRNVSLELMCSRVAT